MEVIAIDLGGTKLASAIFNEAGESLFKQIIPLENRQGAEVSALIQTQILELLKQASIHSYSIYGVGVAVPGIYNSATGNVWAPNIAGWDNYPLLAEIRSMRQLSSIGVKIESDRSCYILGEVWKGCAKDSRNAIFMAIGTGIGAGIMIDGKILHGSQGIAGAVGWFGLDRPFFEKYKSCGCFEYYASGDGVARTARELLQTEGDYQGILKEVDPDSLSSYDIFAAFERGDPVARKTFKLCVEFWGMAAANLISVFNPEIVIFGGGLFGPARKFLDQIKMEAGKWAQPISYKQVTLENSRLGGDAGLVGAGRLAFNE